MIESAKNGGKVLGRNDDSPSPRGGADRLRFQYLGKRKCVFHINPEGAHRILDLAVTEKNLDGMEIAGRPVDDGCLLFFGHCGGLSRAFVDGED